MNQSYMKEQSIFKLLMRLSLPMALSMLVSSLYNIVDSYFIAQISEEALTSLSFVFPIQNLMNAVAIGFGVGINAVISYYLGANEKHRVGQAAGAGILLSVAHGVCFTVLGLVCIRSFLFGFTDQGVIIDLGIRYSRIIFLFTTVNMLAMTWEKIYQALGQMKVAMSAVMIGCIGNLILDPIMIFGWGWIPAMGIEGAALATGIGQFLGLVSYFVVMKYQPLSFKIDWKIRKAEFFLIRRLYAIGLPATLNLALPSIMISVLNSILVSFSSVYVTILGVYYKLQTFLYLPASGMIQGMRPLIGYNYGAGQLQRVSKIYKMTLQIIVVMMAIGTIICLLCPEQLILLFSNQQETIVEGAKALRIICLGFIISSFSVTSSGALEGLGKGGASLWISCFRYVVIVLPLAWGFSQLLGAQGVWWSLSVSEFICALFSWWIYHRAFQKIYFK